MPGKPKPKPLQAFEDNMADAHHLVKLAEGLTNTRGRTMRKELQKRVGDALRVGVRQRHKLDCLESQDVFLTFLPNSRLQRQDFTDHRPLLRQALVAACAATETYLGDKVMDNIGPLLASSATMTGRLRKIPLTLQDWRYIEDQYERRRSGVRHRIIEPYVREQASTAPSQVGVMLSMLGVEEWAKKLDSQRGANKGSTEEMLRRITDRRNKIAHQGDRSGRGRAPLEIGDVKADLTALESVVAAIEQTVNSSR